MTRDRAARGSRIAVTAAALLAVGVAHAAPAEAAPTPDGVHLRGAGATFPAVLYRRWFAEYVDRNPGTTIAYEAVGSGEGLRRFNGRGVKPEERVDFGASEKPEPDPEDRTRGALTVPVIAGGIVLAYNVPGLAGGLRLSREAYVGIFLGEIRRWDHPAIARANPGVKLPWLTIAPVVRQDASGTTFAFTRHLAAVSASWRSGIGAGTVVDWPGHAMRASGNEGVAGRILHAEGSIGYVGLEYARRVGLQLATLENHDGRWVAPQDGAFTAGLAAAPLRDDLRLSVADPGGPDTWPIVTFSWALLYRTYPDARQARALRDLFRWCVTVGQREAAALGYVALPEAVVMRVLAELDGLAPAG